MSFSFSDLVSEKPVITEEEIANLEKKLKQCPLCPGKAFFDESKGFWYVECDKCGCSVPGKDVLDVAYRWNTRITPARPIPREHWTGW
jgi:ribosomal protein L37AE/L43A